MRLVRAEIPEHGLTRNPLLTKRAHLHRPGFVRGIAIVRFEHPNRAPTGAYTLGGIAVLT